MKDSAITVNVKIDAKLFRDFAVFDAFRVKQRWKAPLAFALVMTIFAALCFSRYQTADQAVLIGSVLLAVGLGLPIVYFVNFIVSVNAQIRKLGLTTPKPVYTVTLSEDPEGIRVAAENGDIAQYDWENIYRVYRFKNCAYLYVQSSRAYILPDIDVAEKHEELCGLFKAVVKPAAYFIAKN